MKNLFVEMMSQLTSLTAEEARDIEQSFQIKTYTKDSFLVKEGQLVNNGYHVIEGCVREYKLVDGEEKTTAFYTEKFPNATNFNSLINKTPSTLNFICVEDTTVGVFNEQKEKALYKKHPRFESFCRSGLEQMMGAKQEQLSEFITLKPEQRYEKLQKERPELINRVPQYQIASYLGIQPETLSRIRVRLVNKLPRGKSTSH